jgi:hypothetical protein
LKCYIKIINKRELKTMAKHKLNFEIVNKSDLFFKYKIRLELLQAIYGDNATAEDIKKKNEEIRKGDRR